MLGDFKRGTSPALLIILTTFLWVHDPSLHKEADISPQAASMRLETVCEAGMSNQGKPGEHDSDYLVQSLDADVKSDEGLREGALVRVIVKLEGDSQGAHRGDMPGTASNDTRPKGDAEGDEVSERGRACSIYLDQKFHAFETAVRESIPEAKIIHRFRTETGHVYMLVPINRLNDLVSLPGVDRLYWDECCLE